MTDVPESYQEIDWQWRSYMLDTVANFLEAEVRWRREQLHEYSGLARMLELLAYEQAMVVTRRLAGEYAERGDYPF